MSIARNLSGRCMRQLRAARPALRSSRPAGRRSYASAAETASKAKEAAKSGLTSEIPWLAGAIAVTVPGAYMILSSGPTQNPFKYPLPGSHYHGEEHDEEHEEEHEEGGEEGGEEAPAEESSEEKVEEEKEEDKKDAAEEKATDEKEEEGDNKGEEKDEEKGEEKGDSAKGGSGTVDISNKQKGLSNTETKHPTAETGHMSQKAEGTETAKHEGTVDPGRDAK